MVNKIFDDSTMSTIAGEKEKVSAQVIAKAHICMH